MAYKHSLTKKQTTRLIIIILGLLSLSCFANIKTITTPTFSINLPSQIQPVWQSEDTKINLYRYLFRSLPSSDYSPEQIRTVVIGKAPENESDYPEWELKTLGTMIAMFTDAYHLSLKDQANVLNKKPSLMTLGNQQFSTVTMTFNNMQVKFLVTVVKKSTYMFTLISINNDPKKREKNMEALVASLNTVKYFGIKNN